MEDTNEAVDEALRTIAEAVDTIVDAIHDIWNKVLDIVNTFKRFVIELWEDFMAYSCPAPTEIKLDDILGQSDLLWWQSWRWTNTDLF